MPSDAERIAEEIVSAANVTTCDGYYEVDIDAAAAVIERAIADVVERERVKAKALAEALRKLRDCDWVISLPDRMDAVRDIARDALKAWEK